MNDPDQEWEQDDHPANTTGEWVGPRFVWSAVCRCGWVGPQRHDEYSADHDRLDHVDGGMEPLLSTRNVADPS